MANSTFDFLDNLNFMENMSCLAVMSFHFENRCIMARQIPDCKYIAHYFNYYEMMYCAVKIDNKLTEILVMLLFGIIYCIFLCILYISINQYFSQTLKTAALKLRINEYMAGVLLVGVATSTPDVLVNLSPCRDEAYSLNIAMCSAFTIICLSGGAVCFIRPFRMNGHSICRDLLVLLFVVEVVRLFVDLPGIPSWKKGVVVLCIYPLYLLLNIVDLLLLRYTIKKLRREIEVLRHSTSSKHNDQHLKEKIILLNSLEEEDEIQIRETKLFRQRSANTRFFITPKPLIHHKEVDVETTRTILHSDANPKNLFLFSEFLQAINPIDPDVWYLSGTCARIALVLKSPIVFILRLTIPCVDYQMVKHGWSKLLNCIQIVITPFVVLCMIQTSIEGTYLTWYKVLLMEYAVWSLVITVPLAIIVFLHSRTDIPPPYHSVYGLLTIFTVIVYCWSCAWEMDILVSIIGIVFHLSPSFMSITFNSMSAAAADLIYYAHLAEHGYGKMAFGAIVGGSVFNVVFNVGMELLVGTKLGSHGQVLLFGEEGETIILFLVITILTTIWWSLTFDFSARRSSGVFLWCLFILFFIYISAIEFKWVHGFGVNTPIHAYCELDTRL